MNSRYDIFDPHIFERGDLVYRRDDEDDGSVWIVNDESLSIDGEGRESRMYFIIDSRAERDDWVHGGALRLAPHPLFGPDDPEYQNMLLLQESYWNQDLEELP